MFLIKYKVKSIFYRVINIIYLIYYLFYELFWCSVIFEEKKK